MNKYLILLTFLLISLSLLAGSSAAQSFSISSNDAVQIITQVGATGSFNQAIPLIPTPPPGPGLALKHTRLFNLDGSVMISPPTWFTSATVFLTSSILGPVTPAGSATPCAYFDTTAGDNNPDSQNGFYTISNNQDLLTANEPCRNDKTPQAQLNNIAISITVDRRFMNATDKFMVIVKARPFNAPPVAPSGTNCEGGNYFNPTLAPPKNCTNQLFSLTMGPGGSPPPTPLLIQYLFPSAKALDLLSESVLVPIHTQSNATIISINRIQGGAVFYGVTIIRLP